MYKITGSEIIKKAKGFPSPGTAGEQVLLSDSRNAVLGYKISLSEADSDWSPEDPQFDLGGSGDSNVILKIKSPTFVVWTPYCQEGLGRHPLAELGLSWFDVFQIENSIFSGEEAYLKRNHFIFQFEDSTLDIACADIDKFLFKGSGAELEEKVSEVFKLST
jgi:hypothetical protein